MADKSSGAGSILAGFRCCVNFGSLEGGRRVKPHFQSSLSGRRKHERRDRAYAETPMRERGRYKENNDIR